MHCPAWNAVFGEIPVIERFHIEDLVVQDTSSVLFKALDTVTGRTVALRRLLPFGVNGGGLNDSEQADYAEVIRQLSNIAHPALRTVVSGGCDPIDGMPYIATEWVEGPRLSDFVAAKGPLGPVESADLLTKALEVCELISQVLGREGVWLETDTRSVVIGSPVTGRGVTFWISPLRWLGKTDGKRGLQPIVGLTEEIKGWQEKTISAKAGGGLGGWLNWMRQSSRTTTLHEARRRLADAMGTQRPIPTGALVRQAKSGARSGSPRWMTAAALVVLVTAGFGAWMFARNLGGSWNGRAHRFPAAPVILTTRMVHSLGNEGSDGFAGSPDATDLPSFVSVPGETIQQRANRKLAEFSASGAQARIEGDETLTQHHAELTRRERVFAPTDRALLMNQKGMLVKIEGILERIEQSRKTTYFIFEKATGSSDPRAAFVTADAPDDLHISQLESLIGKRIRVQGMVKVEALQQRPTIVIKQRNAIETVE